MKVKVIVSWVIVLLAFIVRDMLTRNVTIFLPEQFKGFIMIIESPESGVDLSISSKGIEIEVPPDGRVELSSIRWLRKWSLSSAVYESGESLPVLIMGQETKERYALWILPVPAGERLYRYVGYKSEAEEFVDANSDRIYRSPPLDP